MQTAFALLTDHRFLLIASTVFFAMRREPNQSAFNNKYAAGISYDAVADCRLALKTQQKKNNSLSMFLSENDLVFQPQEIIETLQKAQLLDKGICITILQNTWHSSLAARASKGVLKEAIDSVRRENEQ
jgi:hypothetical protein